MGGPAGNETGANGSSAAQTPEVAFLYATFPRPTETFVRRELRALWGLGAKVAPFSIWKGAPAFEGRPVERFRLRELWSLAWWLPYWACRRPVAFREILYDLWSRPCPSLQNWNETFLALGFALVRAESFRRRGFRLCHAVWATMPATAALALKKLVGIEFSFGAHAYDVFRSRGDWLLSRKLREAAFVRTSSASTERRLLDLGLPSQRLKLIRRGLSKWPEPSLRETLADPVEILSVGRLVPKKGYFEQLRILHALLAAGLPFRARIVGGGPLREELERESSRLGLSRHLAFLGHLTEAETLALYPEADLFLFTGKTAPDGDRDGVPNVIPEAMAAGNVVLTSSSGGAAEVVEHGKTGYVLDPARPADWVETIRALLRAPETLRALRYEARAGARRRFDVKRAARELLAALSHACER